MLKTIAGTRYKEHSVLLSELELVLTGCPGGDVPPLGRASIRIWLDESGDEPQIRVTVDAAPDSPLPQSTTSSKPVSFAKLYEVLHGLVEETPP